MKIRIFKINGKTIGFPIPVHGECDITYRQKGIVVRKPEVL
jgi:hypothetical protein